MVGRGLGGLVNGVVSAVAALTVMVCVQTSNDVEINRLHNYIHNNQPEIEQNFGKLGYEIINSVATPLATTAEVLFTLFAGASTLVGSYKLMDRYSRRKE